jgi:hypothetical protein
MGYKSWGHSPEHTFSETLSARLPASTRSLAAVTKTFFETAAGSYLTKAYSDEMK